MNKYFLYGKFTVKAGLAEELVTILLEASRLVSTAKGCRLYIIGKDSNDKNSVWVTEVWDSKEDHDNSLKVEGVKELISKAMPMFAEQPQKIKELEIVGGHLPANEDGKHN
jgi:quinol monooxygenase YgiN